MGVDPSCTNWVSSLNPDVARNRPAFGKCSHDPSHHGAFSDSRGRRYRASLSKQYGIQAGNQSGVEWLAVILGCYNRENTTGPGTGSHDSDGTAWACVHLPPPIHRQSN